MPVVKSPEGNLFALFFIGGEVALLVDSATLAIKFYRCLAIFEIIYIIVLNWDDFFADFVNKAIFLCLGIIIKCFAIFEIAKTFKIIDVFRPNARI